jgi:hypothetical protein
MKGCLKKLKGNMRKSRRIEKNKETIGVKLYIRWSYVSPQHGGDTNTIQILL